MSIYITYGETHYNPWNIFMQFLFSLNLNFSRLAWMIAHFIINSSATLVASAQVTLSSIYFQYTTIYNHIYSLCQKFDPPNCSESVEFHLYFLHCMLKPLNGIRLSKHGSSSLVDINFQICSTWWGIIVLGKSDDHARTMTHLEGEMLNQIVNQEI